jgi:hypothetical protein
MADLTERMPRRGMTFPFFLTLVIFVAVIADLWLTGPGFVASSAWRQHAWIFAGTVILGFLLWFWVLAAARRRSNRFEGPIETTRGSNGALQPILATIFLVVGLNLLWNHTLPKWLNSLVADDVATEDFVLAGDIAAYRSGCSRAAATNPRFGEVKLCLPRGLADSAREASAPTVAVTGAVSWFGIEPRRYTLPAEEPMFPAELTVEPAADTAPADGAPVEVVQSVDELFEQIFGSDEPTPAGKTGKSRN